MRSELKIFIGCVIGIIGVTFLFIPPSMYEAYFWRYLNETAPIYWIGQNAWLLIGALLLTIGIVTVKRLTE